MSVWERSWNMNAGSNGLKKTQFSLERHQTDGIVYYTMKIEKLGAAADASEAEAWEQLPPRAARAVPDALGAGEVTEALRWH